MLLISCKISWILNSDANLENIVELSTIFSRLVESSTIRCCLLKEKGG